MIGLDNNGRSTVASDNTAAYTFFFRAPITNVTGTSTYDNWVPRGYQHPTTRRERQLAAERARLAEKIRRFGESVLVHRIARAEQEKKVQLDARSRGRSAPAPTKKQDARRLQTYQAAMDMRQLRR